MIEFAYFRNKFYWAQSFFNLLFYKEEELGGNTNPNADFSK